MSLNTCILLYLIYCSFSDHIGKNENSEIILKKIKFYLMDYMFMQLINKLIL